MLILGVILIAIAIGIFWANDRSAPPAPVVQVAKSLPAPAPPPPPNEPVVPEEPAPTAAKDTAQTPAERLAAAVALLTSPTFNEASAQQARELIDSTYAPLYAQLNLSPADAAALGDLLTQRLSATRAAFGAAASQGLDLANNPVEVAVLARTAVAPVETQIANLLGSDGYQQYQTYAAPLRAAVVSALLQAPASPSKP